MLCNNTVLVVVVVVTVTVNPNSQSSPRRMIVLTSARVLEVNVSCERYTGRNVFSLTVTVNHVVVDVALSLSLSLSFLFHHNVVVVVVPARVWFLFFRR